jgi:hypothetical protein
LKELILAFRPFQKHNNKRISWALGAKSFLAWAAWRENWLDYEYMLLLMLLCCCECRWCCVKKNRKLMTGRNKGHLFGLSLMIHPVLLLLLFKFYIVNHIFLVQKNKCQSCKSLWLSFTACPSFYGYFLPAKRSINKEKSFFYIWTVLRN